MGSQSDKLEKAALIVALIVAASAILDHAIGSKWQNFTSAEGSFSVLMPGRPEKETHSFSVNLVTLEQHSFVVHSRRYGDFTVAYVDNPAISAQATADALLESKGQGLSQLGNVISSEKMDIGGFPVRQYKIKAEADLQADERIYLVKHRMYVLLVIHGKDDDESGVTHFFDSFTFQASD
jgi:hypothetical protein